MDSILIVLHKLI